MLSAGGGVGEGSASPGKESKGRIRVIVTDDHPVVLKGLEGVLAAEPDIQIAGSFTDSGEALRAVRARRPDILVLDLMMPGIDGLAMLRALAAESLPTRTVLLAAAVNHDELLEAIHLGVGGVVLKEMAPRLLVQCIRKVHAGEPWIERSSAAQAFKALLRREAGARQLADLLTPREIAVVRLVAQGLRNRAIGEALHIREGTVKTHQHAIYEKLHVKSRAELIVYCSEKGIV